MRKLSRILLFAVLLGAMFGVTSAVAAVTPDAARGIFDAWAVAIMLVWGGVVKHFPGLGRITNHAIGWLNFLGYALARLMGRPAEAGVLDALPDAAGLLLGAATNVGWAHILYETLGRSLLTRVLRLKRNDGRPHSFERAR